jgi:predicted DsbA family dithiol-disulfide isomerase
MNEMIQDGAVCGLDGCSTSATAATPQTNTSPQPGAAHNLTIVSDVICPWCFVAKMNLESSLKLAGSNLKVEVTWKPFELNPDMPKEGMNRRAYRSRKFGSWEHSQALDAQVATAAAQAGIEFRHDLMERTPNTFNAHRLIWLAGREGAQDAVVEALFRAYFMEGRDVGDASALIEIAAQAGLDRTQAEAFLEGTEGTEEVRREARAAMASGISGVPTFILDGEALFSGSLKPELMAARLTEAALAHAER